MAMVSATIAPAGAQPAPLPDKPFAEHRIALQLSDNDPKKQGLVISVAYNLLKAYDPDKVAIEVVRDKQHKTFELTLTSPDKLPQPVRPKEQEVPGNPFGPNFQAVTKRTQDLAPTAVAR